MILHPGCKKALYATSAIPLEAWGTDWTGRPQGLRHRGLIPNKMDNCNWHQQFPTWNLEKNSKKMWNCTLNLHQFPMWNLGTESRTGVFHSKNLKIAVWKAKGLAPGRVICQLYWLQAESFTSSSWLYWELESKVNGAQSERNLPVALWNSEKDSELKSVHGTPRLCFLLSPDAIESLLQSHYCHQIC